MLASGPPSTLVSINIPSGLPGVVRVLQASDVPGSNLLFGSMVGAGEPLFVPVGGQTAYDGEPVALVIATAQHLAESVAIFILFFKKKNVIGVLMMCCRRLRASQ